MLYIANKLQEIRFGRPKEVRILQFAELKTWAFWRAVLAEFVGTLLFVFLGVASTVPLGGPQSTVKVCNIIYILVRYKRVNVIKYVFDILKLKVIQLLIE